MSLTLIKLPAYPERLAVTKVGAISPGGTFFLDFTRPIEVLRWFGVRNRWFGFAVGLLVPIVHEGEERGGFVISVNVGDPYFPDVRLLWKTRYPSEGFAPTTLADGLSVIGDFATQFPGDAESPRGA